MVLVFAVEVFVDFVFVVVDVVVVEGEIEVGFVVDVVVVEAQNFVVK